jgi:serine/threonine protein kinase
MGEVYRAKDLRLGREVAIKVLPAAFAMDAERLRRFEVEARSVGSLNHPNILSVFDIGMFEDAPYLVMELLEGTTLREKLGGKPLPVRRAVDVAFALATGLAAAHEKGIIHRDLKPENVFITKDGRIKILDFGLAKALTPLLNASEDELPTRAIGSEPSLTEAGMVVGTVGYMSPEQARGERLDGRSDLFSLGTMFWEMLAGHRPFLGATPLDTLTAILKEDPPALDASLKIPPALERILHGCLAKEPSGRFHSAHDLAFALEGVATTFSSRIDAVKPVSRLRIWLRLLLPLAGAIIVSALLGLARFRQWPPFKPQELPTFTRLTFHRGNIRSARFSPDGRSVFYSARWEGQPEDVYLLNTVTLESRPLGLPPGSTLLDISSTGELAIRVPPVYSERGTLARVPLTGGTPRELQVDVENAAWSPDGQSLAAIRRLGGKAVLEYPLGKPIYETTGVVRHLRMSPSGQQLAFINLLSGVNRWYIRVVDLDGQVQTLDPGPGFVYGLAWKPDGKSLTSSLGPDAARLSLWEFPLQGKARNLYRGPGSLAFCGLNADGRWLVEYGISRQEAFLQTGSMALKDISWRDRARVGGLSESADMVLLAEGGGGAPSSVLLRRAGAREPVRLGDGKIRGGFSPDGKWVAVLSADARLILVPTGPGETRTVPLGGLMPLDAQWHPDGRLLLHARGPEPGKEGLYVVDGSGSRFSPLRNDFSYSSFVVDAQGTSAVATKADGGLVLIPLGEGPIRDLPIRLASGERLIQWSGDGRFLYLVQFEGVAHLGRIDRVELTSGKRSLWKQLPIDSAEVPWLNAVAISRDGSSLAYSFEHQPVADLYFVDGLN